MDYVKFTMTAGKDIVEHMMPVETAEQLIKTAKEKKTFCERGKYYITADGYTFRIRKPKKGDENVFLL